MWGDGQLRLAADVLVCLGLLLGPSLLVAREPDGSVRLEADWIDRDAWLAQPTTRHALQIRIEPFVELRDCRLSFELSRDVVFESADAAVANLIEERASSPQAKRVAEIPLGSIPSSRILRFDIARSAAADPSPIRLTLWGHRVDGSEFLTTLSLPLLPDDRPPGRRHHGAWEFDASNREEAP